MGRVRWTALVTVIVFMLALAGEAYAQQPPPPPPPPGGGGQPQPGGQRRQAPPAPNNPSEVSKESIEAAVQKGIAYLRTQQRADGSWDYRDGPFTLNMPGVDTHLTMGCAALCCLAMLKGGVKADDPAIKKGLDYCRNHPLQHVYCVSCLILALEALYSEPEPEEEKEKEATPEEKMRTGLAKDPAKDFRKKASPQDKAKIIDLIKWLLENQQANVWRYPMHGEDASNSQYVALAFSAAMRMKVPIPASNCRRMAEWFLKWQEKDGPEVKGFPVPAADHSMKELRKLEKDIQKQMREIDKDLKKDKDKDKADGMTTTVVDEAREKLFAPEKNKMFARGWCYMPEDPQNQAWRKVITGSMTTSGIIALTVCKAYLEGTSECSAGMAKAVSKGIRDGCAWIAHKFTVTQNPTGGGENTIHHYYYLYGLERAGMITLTPKFGDHDWYKEGAGLILSQQRSDGSWEATQGTSGPVPDTCFAILFLKKATKPIVSIPERPETGGDLFGPGGKKK
jgi:hypothetical protein